MRSGIKTGLFGFFFSSRRRHTRSLCDWSSDVCSSDLRGRLPSARALPAPRLFARQPWQLSSASPSPTTHSTEGRVPALLSSVSSSSPASPSFDPHAAPEGDAVFDLQRRILRLRVVPSRIPVHVAAHDHVVITRRPLPGTDRVRLALAEVFTTD